MNINVSQELKTFEGEPMKDADEAGLTSLLNAAVDLIKDPADKQAIVKMAEAIQKPVTLRLALLRALGAGMQGTPPEDLVTLYKIAVTMPKEGEFELSAEEVVKLKAAVSKYYISPLLVGQLYALLDPKAA